MAVWQVLLVGFILAVWSLVCAMVGAVIAINARKTVEPQRNPQSEPWRAKKMPEAYSDEKE